MRIENLYEGDVSHIPDEVFEKIYNSPYFKNNYMNWLNDKSRDYDDEPYRNLYRGMDSEKDITVIKRYKKRKPLDTIQVYHTYTNLLSSKKLGVNVRDMIFSRGSRARVTLYGNPYILFPLGEYNIYFHPKMADYTQELHLDLPISISVNQVTKEVFGDFKSLMPIKLDVKALLDGIELKDIPSFREELNKRISMVTDILYDSAEKTYGEVEITKEELYKKLSISINSTFEDIQRYVDEIESTKYIKDLGHLEAMIDADEIIAIQLEDQVEFFTEMTDRYRK